MSRTDRTHPGRARRSIFKGIVLPTLTGSAIVVALTVGTEGCGTSAAAESAPAAPVVTLMTQDIATVERRDLPTGPIVSGTLTARRHATIRAEIAGAVTAVHADRGSTVDGGAPLLRIDGRSIKDVQISATADVDADDNAVALARRRLTRSEALLAGGAISAESVEDARQALWAAESKRAASQARLASANDALARTIVHAPFAGVVSARNVNIGDDVESGAVVFEVIDPRTMRLEASIPAADLAAIRIGAPIAFTVTGYPGRTFTGRIERVNPAADPATRQVPVFVAIENGDGKLVAGLFAEGRVAPSVGPALLVPGAAIERTNGRDAVVRFACGRMERRPVVTGREGADGGFVEIRSGLALGDTVVIGVSRSVPSGTAARVSGATGGSVATPTSR